MEVLGVKEKRTKKQKKMKKKSVECNLRCTRPTSKTCLFDVLTFLHQMGQL